MQIFEENARKSTLYFAWREGEEIVPEVVGKGEKSLQRLFLETQVLFFILFTGLGIVLFLIIAIYYPDAIVIAPLILVAVQFIFVFYSTWFIARSSDWTITKANPTIHFLEYHLPLLENGEFSKGYPPEQLTKIKKEVYDEILAKHGEIDCELAQKVFEKYGVSCQSENLTSKKVNVYELVKKIADKFGYPMPKIVVSNTILPNAAASGPSPSRGLVLITTGLLVQLEEKEILSVLGHEFGHLKGRDPLLLYGLSSAEFLFRFYVLLNFFPDNLLIFPVLHHLHLGRVHGNFLHRQILRSQSRPHLSDGHGSTRSLSRRAGENRVPETAVRENTVLPYTGMGRLRPSPTHILQGKSFREAKGSCEG